MININNSTKGKRDESSKIEQIWTDQTSNVEDGQTDDDNKRYHTAITKHCRKKKKKNKTKLDFIMKLFITSHNKNQ